MNGVISDSGNCYDKEKAVTSWWSWGTELKFHWSLKGPLNQYLNEQEGSQSFQGH